MCKSRILMRVRKSILGIPRMMRARVSESRKQLLTYFLILLSLDVKEWYVREDQVVHRESSEGRATNMTSVPQRRRHS